MALTVTPHCPARVSTASSLQKEKGRSQVTVCPFAWEAESVTRTVRPGVFSEMFRRPVHGRRAQGWEKTLLIKLHKHQFVQDDSKSQCSQRGTALTQKANISTQTPYTKHYRALHYKQFMRNSYRSSLIRSSHCESSPFTQAFPFHLPM